MTCLVMRTLHAQVSVLEFNEIPPFVLIINSLPMLEKTSAHQCTFSSLLFSFTLFLSHTFSPSHPLNTLSFVTPVQRLINKNRLPHLLFYGPPGTGKTSTVVAIAHQLYGGAMQSMVLSLNASDDRGIDVVRDQIKTFAGTRKLFSSGMKLVILDEADHMTNDAQFALRRVIEKYSSNARFCIICNYVSKIIPALQSRCTKFRFSPLDHANMLVQAKRTVEAEGLSIDEDAVEMVVTLAMGDMRRVLNVLQVRTVVVVVVVVVVSVVCCCLLLSCIFILYSSFMLF